MHLARAFAVSVVAGALLAGGAPPVAAGSAAVPLAVSGAVGIADAAGGGEGAPGAAAGAAPSLGAQFELSGEWLEPGVVGLGWPDMGAATGWEVLYRAGDGWQLLTGGESADGVSVSFAGSTATVSGLPEGTGGYRFAVRARNVWGVSEWSASVQVGAPADPPPEPLFDPFTAPTLSDIDLERLADAVATVEPGASDCAAAAPLSMAGLRPVDAPTDPVAAPTAAEVVRIAAGCILVEYVALDGRTVDQVRILLAGHPEVHAVGEPTHSPEPEHDRTNPKTHRHDDFHGHHDDGGGPQWHLTAGVTALWDDWDPKVPVTVAVLDSGVDVTHEDLDSRIVPGSGQGCHGDDYNGHGTGVAGIIAAEHRNGKDVAGVAPQAHILPLRVVYKDQCKDAEGNAETDEDKNVLLPPVAIARAVNKGARVINLSIAGAAKRDEPGLQVKGIPIPSKDTYELVARAASMVGVVLVAAIGNCGGDKWEDQGCGERDEQERPAMYPDVIAVASLGHEPQGPTGIRRAISSANDDVDIAAPGHQIRTTAPIVYCNKIEGQGTGPNKKPDKWVPIGCQAPDEETDIQPPPQPCRSGETPRASTRVMPVLPDHSCAHPVDESFGGTSAAAPFVSGVVAHMINRFPDATPGQIRAALESSAHEPPDVDLLSRRTRGSVGGGPSDEALWADYDDYDPEAYPPRPPVKPGPTREYGRGIVNPQGALARLAASFVPLSPGPGDGWFVEVSAGERHSCGRYRSGAVVCWGDAAVSGAVPPHAFESLSSPPSGRFVCGVREGDGAAQCWGELPEALTSPVAVSLGRNALPGEFSQLAVGDRHVCGLRPAGQVVCWGDDSDGQTVVPFGDFAARTGHYVVAVAAGSAHSCAVLATRSVSAPRQVRCWGADSAGQASGADGWNGTDVAAGRDFTCVRDLAGRVRCVGGIVDAPAAGHGEPYAAVWAGADHACALVAVTRELRCWGEDGDGRLDVPQGAFSEASLGAAHGCALLPGVRLRCWGTDEYELTPAEGRLGSLSVSVGGVDLLEGRFDPEVFDYTVSTDAAKVKVAAEVDVGEGTRSGDGTHSRLVMRSRSGAFSFPLGSDFHVDVSDGSMIEVTAGAIFGQAERRTYRVHVAVPPRLASLRLIPDGTGPHCTPQCKPLELIPAFDPAVTEYRAVAAADVSLLTVQSRPERGVAMVSPADAAARAGHQLPLSTDTGFVSLSVGGGHSCGVKADQSVVCWGESYYGQLDAPSGTFVAVSADGSHSCGIKTDETVVCWGRDDDGQSGAPSGSFTAVAAGYSHACAVRTDTSVVCWGDDRFGQADAPSGSFTAVAAGYRHSCGIMTDRSVVCWGDDDDGRLDAPSDSFVDVAVSDSHSCGIMTDRSVVCWGDDGHRQLDAPSGSFVDVAAGGAHSCGVRSSGTLVCWGWPRLGQADAPPGSFVDVAAGDLHSCGIMTDGTAVCWGWNRYGQLDAPSGSFVDVAAGGAHSCGIMTDGTAVCWGWNHHGQLDAPLGSFVSIAAGISHTCGIRADGTAECWGSNHFGQADAPSGSFAAIALGQSHSCAVQADAAVVCWGLGSVRINAPSGSFVSIAASFSHSCGIRVDQSVACWGSNYFGQSDAPSGSFVEVAAGSEHSCGIRVDQSVACWGSNYFGQSDAPSGSFVAVAAMYEHSCGIRVDRSVACWGARYRSLEPAKPLTIVLDVRDRVGATAKRRYTVRVTRPKPPYAGSMPAASRSAEAAGAAADSPLTGCTEPEACPWQDLWCATASAECLTSGVAGASGLLADAGTAGASGQPTSHADGAQEDDAVPVAAGWAGVCPAVNVSDSEAAERVVFDDKVLHRAVAAALGEAPDTAVTRGDLATLETLADVAPPDDAPRITSLAGLEYAVNLTSLDLRGHEITDLGPAGCLRRLAHAELGGNRISDVGPLRSLDGLRTLGLSANRISDIGWLAKLDGMQALDVSHNDIADLTALSGHAKLTALNMGGNRISDLAPISGLTSLRTLLAYDNQIADIGPLAKLSGLRTLMVDRNQIASIDPVATMRDLQTLSAAGNRIEHVWALVWKHRLERVYLSDNQITHPHALTLLPALRTLWADGNLIDSPRQLRSLKLLDYLDIRHNRIADAAVLDTLASTAHTQPQDTG